MFEEINNHQQWRIVEKINKGWSDDTKYYIETIDHILPGANRCLFWRSSTSRRFLENPGGVCSPRFTVFNQMGRAIWTK